MLRAVWYDIYIYTYTFLSSFFFCVCVCGGGGGGGIDDIQLHQRRLLPTWINFNPAWISSYIYYKLRDKITYRFPNFKGCPVEVWEWMSNFILHITTGHVITYPCWCLAEPALRQIQTWQRYKYRLSRSKIPIVKCYSGNSYTDKLSLYWNCPMLPENMILSV